MEGKKIVTWAVGTDYDKEEAQLFRSRKDAEEFIREQIEQGEDAEVHILYKLGEAYDVESNTVLKFTKAK